MKRRTSLKVIAAGAIGIMAIGYWAKDLDVIRDLLSNSFFKPTEQDTIAAIADTIIPRSDQLYGAVDLGVPIYLLAYFEKCEKPEIQENLKLQLKNIDLSANEKFNLDFVDCGLEERTEMLMDFADSSSEDQKAFFKLMKDQTLRGFRTTEEVMARHYDYKVVPGEYRGCLDISEAPII